MSQRQIRETSRVLAVMAVLTLAILAFVAVPDATGQEMTGKATYTPEFTADGQLKVPKLGSWRNWPFLGTPVTPNDMNKGEAPFPEFHHVYMEPSAFAHYEKTGVFPEGTVITKELVTVGTKKASSGRGYFEGEFNGFEIAHKSKKLYPKEPGNWAYYSFGHHAPPYEATAKAQPTANCAACHETLADEDMVFTQYYTNLRAAKPKK